MTRSVRGPGPGSPMNQPRLALSIRQPWAWAILHAGKDIENRTWPTRFRGRILIHAAKTWDADGEDTLDDLGFCCPTEGELSAQGQLGAIVGEVTLADCLEVEECDSEWATGPYCFVLEDPLAYETPIPYRGRLGLFPVEKLR